VATHVVCKPLPIATGVLPSGTPVDASGWRNTDRLVASRYLRPLRADEQDNQSGAPVKRLRGQEVPANATH